MIALRAVFHSRAGERQDSRVEQFKLGTALTAINDARRCRACNRSERLSPPQPDECELSGGGSAIVVAA